MCLGSEKISDPDCDFLNDPNYWATVNLKEIIDFDTYETLVKEIISVPLNSWKFMKAGYLDPVTLKNWKHSIRELIDSGFTAPHDQYVAHLDSGWLYICTECWVRILLAQLDNSCV